MPNALGSDKLNQRVSRELLVSTKNKCEQLIPYNLIDQQYNSDHRQIYVFVKSHFIVLLLVIPEK